jgi:REP element-mobilizing transposase RayT
VIRLVLKKYKSIKLYHEFEEIKKQYRFNKPEIFLRGVLKVITRFQPCEIKF